VGVLKFSLGFGPKLIGRKIGETEYLIAAIPLGGYVKMLGESEDDEILSPEDEKRSFQKQPVLKRIGIVAAGPISNFIFAIIAFSLIYSAGIPTITSKVGDVEQGSAAFEAGIQKDDVIIAIDGREVSEWMEIVDAISGGEGKELKISLARGNKVIDVHLKPKLVDATNIFGEESGVYRIGVSASSELVVKKLGLFRAFLIGIEQTWTIAKLTVIGIFKIVQGVISPKTIGGPILIAQMAGVQAQKGIVPFVFFMSMLSINLGVLNLFPIPVLDGGHLLFYIIEAITGREVKLKWRERAQQIGFLLLIMLMLFAFYNDISRTLGG
jgi:regulator of sigma E protease